MRADVRRERIPGGTIGVFVSIISVDEKIVHLVRGAGLLRHFVADLIKVVGKIRHTSCYCRMTSQILRIVCGEYRAEAQDLGCRRWPASQNQCDRTTIRTSASTRTTVGHSAVGAASAWAHAAEGFPSQLTGVFHSVKDEVYRCSLQAGDFTDFASGANTLRNCILDSF